LFLETRTRMITIIIMNGKIGKLFFTLLFSFALYLPLKTSIRAFVPLSSPL
jgi:hypothetical protein